MTEEARKTTTATSITATSTFGMNFDYQSPLRKFYHTNVYSLVKKLDISQPHSYFYIKAKPTFSYFPVYHNYIKRTARYRRAL